MAKAKILVVDDRPSIVEVLSLYLQLHEYQTLQAYDGRAALELARKEKPNLVLLDLILPEMTGFEVLRALQADPELASMPVVVMTARADLDAPPAQGLEAAAAILRKPFDLDQVALVVERLLLGQTDTETAAG